MKELYILTELATGGDIRYVPVPCRGNVHSVRLVCDTTMVATGTLKIGRGDPSTAAYCVNTATAPAGNTAAGTILDGVPDATYEALIFDPDSSTASHKVLWIETDSTLLGGGATLGIFIKFDDSAFVEQAAKEA